VVIPQVELGQDPEQRAQELGAWRAKRGIRHLCVHAVGVGLTTAREHVRALEQLKKDVLG